MKYAIDIPKFQQLYVRYSNKYEKEELFSILSAMQFDLAEGIKEDQYKFPIITLNYLEKRAFGSNVSCMASAMQSGAVVLSIDQFAKEFFPYVEN